MAFSLYEYSELARNLVKKDFKLKYRWSLLGFAWSLINPLSLIFVYSVAFSVILKVPVENFPLYLISGIIPWLFCAATLQGSTMSVINNAGLIKNIDFPRKIVPLSDLLFNFVEFVLTLGVFLPIAYIVLGAKVSAGLLFFPVVLTLQFLFLFGVSLLLSSATVFFRDLEHIIEVILRPIFWMTPVVYTVSMVPDKIQLVYLINPFAPYIISYQDIFYRGQIPQTQNLGLMVFWTIVSLAIGHVVFDKYSPYFAEEI